MPTIGLSSLAALASWSSYSPIALKIPVALGAATFSALLTHDRFRELTSVKALQVIPEPVKVALRKVDSSGSYALAVAWVNSESYLKTVLSDVRQRFK